MKSTMEIRTLCGGAPEAAGDDEEAFQALQVLLRYMVKRQQTGAGPSTPESWLTLAEGAKYAAVSEDTLRAWIGSGQLKVGRCGKVIRVRRTAIDALLCGEVTPEPSASGNTFRERRAEQLSREAASGGPGGRGDDAAVSDTARSILRTLGKGRKQHG